MTILAHGELTLTLAETNALITNPQLSAGEPTYALAWSSTDICSAGVDASCVSEESAQPLSAEAPSAAARTKRSRSGWRCL